MLDRGTYPNVDALAKHTLRLNYPAPDIVEAVLQGREPSGLSLTKLTEPLPAGWEEQCAQLGFTSAKRHNLAEVNFRNTVFLGFSSC